MRSRELSKTTLFGRVHEQIRLEARRDVDALLDLIDPELRAAPRAADAPDSDRARIEAFVGDIRTARIEHVEILDATRVAPGRAGRSAARVRTVVRYNDAIDATHIESDWVRDRGVWYTTRYPPTER